MPSHNQYELVLRYNPLIWYVIWVNQRVSQSSDTHCSAISISGAEWFMASLSSPSVYFHLRFEEISNIDLNLCPFAASSFHIRENMESVADLEDKKTNFQLMVMLSFYIISGIFRHIFGSWMILTRPSKLISWRLHDYRLWPYPQHNPLKINVIGVAS